MKIFKDILEDKFINGFVVALILGISTINVINTAAGMILDHVFQVATSPWSWKIFFGQLTLYGMAVIIAIIIRGRVSS